MSYSALKTCCCKSSSNSTRLIFSSQQIAFCKKRDPLQNLNFKTLPESTQFKNSANCKLCPEMRLEIKSQAHFRRRLAAAAHHMTFQPLKRMALKSVSFACLSPRMSHERPDRQSCASPLVVFIAVCWSSDETRKAYFQSVSQFTNKMCCCRCLYLFFSILLKKRGTCWFFGTQESILAVTLPYISVWVSLSDL